MSKLSRTALLVCLCTLHIVLPSTSARAAEPWPSQPITYVVPFAPGSNTDVLGRIIADQLSKTLKVSVIVENKPGATGMIGSSFAAKAKPDGYTILGGSIASHAINAALVARLPYDPIKSFEPITIIGFNANTLVVPKDSPWKSVADVIAAAKASPDAVSYASSGIGTTQHLSGVLLGQIAGVKLAHVPYGSKSALSDLVGGHISMMFEGPAILPHVQQGTVRALAVTSAHRLPALPNVPTMQEAGVIGYEMRAWQAVFAVKGTPAPIVEALYRAIQQALADPDTLAKLNTMGVQPSGMPPAEFAAFQKHEVERWRTLIRQANIQPQ